MPLARTPFRLARAAIEESIRLELRVAHVAASALNGLALEAVDALLARLIKGEAVGVVLRRLQASGVPQRVAEWLLEDGVAEEIATRILQGPELGRILSATLDSDQTQAALGRALESESLVRTLDSLTSSPGSERLISLLLASPLAENAVVGLLQSEPLWVLVDEVARSPSVTDAISHQSRGFLEEVADKARGSSRDADAWVQRLVHGRRRDTSGGAGSLPFTEANTS